jgi:predicted nucleic acid-binding protein
MAHESLICDSSFVGHLMRRRRLRAQYSHWDTTVLERVDAGDLAVSVVTIAEVRAGYLRAGWGDRRVEEAEGFLATFVPIAIDDPHLVEWARLWVAARKRGVALSDNDLWVAATASTRRQALMTCDRDHVRIAPEPDVEVIYFAPPV